MPSQSQIDEADNTAYASMRATHFPSTSMSLSSINMPSQNAHIALVRNLSSGRPVWWIDHGISSSRRAEVIMRRKMVYLQEEHDNNNARAASTNTPAVVPIIDAVGCGGGVKVTQTTIERQNNMMDSSATESMSSSSSSTIPLPQLHPSIDNSQYENGTERKILSVASDQMEFMYDNNKNICRESSLETQPQSPNEVGCNDSNNFLHDASTIHGMMMKNEENNGRAQQHDTLLDEHSVYLPPISASGNIDSATLPLSHHHHHHLNDNIPMVQLLLSPTTSTSSSSRQQRTYLDFGCEGNIVGKNTHQYFCIVAPPPDDEMECNDGDNSDGDGGQEFFHIQLTKCCPRSGIACTRHYYNNTMENDDARDILSCDDTTNVLSFQMKRGESTTMDVTWNPTDDGSMRETIVLEVRNSRSGAHWIQSLVLVGEAHCVGVNNDNDDEAVEQCVGTGDALVELQDGIMGEKHNINMVSDITDTISYSRGEITLEDSGTFNYGEDLLSLEGERHDHRLHHHLHLYDLEGIQVEDDSMAYSQETNEVLLLPKTDDKTNDVENVLLWNANLSEIQEVGENDGNTRSGEKQLLLPQSGDIDRHCSTTTHKANQISVSLESGSVLLGDLAKIDETSDNFMDISTIRSVEPSFDILPEEPCESGQPKKETNGASTLAKSDNDDSEISNHITELAKAEEIVIISSAEALKHDMDIRMENWEKGWISKEEKEKQTTRIIVDLEHQRLQSKQINDFEDLLVSEGLVESEGNTLADDTDASDSSQIELVMDINSSLTNFIENMRSKSPSFGSFSSKDSIDDQNSSSLAGEAQDHVDDLPFTHSSQDDVDIEVSRYIGKQLFVHYFYLAAAPCVSQFVLILDLTSLFTLSQPCLLRK